MQKVVHLNHDIFRECSALNALFDIYNISTYYLRYIALLTEESIHYFKVMKIEGRLICHECITLSPWHCLQCGQYEDLHHNHSSIYVYWDATDYRQFPFDVPYPGNRMSANGK